jgi:uncharacterized protein (TIGR00369 family)
MSSDLVLSRVAESFARQGLMTHFGARLLEGRDGRCVIEVPAKTQLLQQHGFFHAGVASAIADTAAGYAALSLMPGDASVLTVEFKINLIAPADGELLRATGSVIRSGRTITATSARVEAVRSGEIVHCAEFLGTMIAYHRAETRV